MSVTTPPTAVAAPPPAQRPRRTRRLWTGIVAGPLFLAVALVAGFIREDYDPARHPVSSLSIGPGGWVQIANFIVAGLLTLVFAVRLRTGLKASGRRTFAGPLLIGVWAVGLLGAGVFVGDPISGYPAGTPATGIHTWHGQLHDVPFSAAGFLAMIAACLVFAYRFATWRQFGWAAYSGLSGLLVAVGIVLSSAGFAQGDLVDIAGLLQRATVAVGLAWLTALAVHVRNCERR